MAERPHENHAKTPANLDSRLQVSQFFHADACVRCCAGFSSHFPHGAKHSLKNWAPRYSFAGILSFQYLNLKIELVLQISMSKKNFPEPVTNVYFLHHEVSLPSYFHDLNRSLQGCLIDTFVLEHMPKKINFQIFFQNQCKYILG